MKKSSSSKRAASCIDAREQPYNSRETGPIDRVQLPVENITVLHGIVLDVDLDLYRPDGPTPLDLSSPRAFADSTLIPMLDRHAALRGAEVRDSGRNIHVIVWLAEPVVLADDGTRRRWAGMVKVIQASLPIDPDMPGITALTRPVGSINSRTNRPVAILRPGTPVPASELLKLHDQMTRTPFQAVMGILFGPDRVSPCPICRAAGSSLAALPRHGQCYGSCGKVKLERLYDVFLAPRALITVECADAIA